MLPEAWEKRLIDLNVASLGEADLAWADVVFIGGMIAQRESARALIARCRAAGKTVVAGGPLFTSEHAEFPEVDHFVPNEASINLADDAALTRQMVAAGFDAVFIGIETPEEAGLAECNKRQNRGRDLIADIKRLQRAGLEVQGGFIVGFDSDTVSIFRRQLEFIQQSGITTAMVGMLTALPGTRLFERLKREGRLLGPSSGNNGDGTTNFLPRMELEPLRDGYRELMAAIYAPGPYYRRVRTFLREFHPPRLAFRFDVKALAAFIRSAMSLGVIGRERFQYWRLLGWTMCRRPRLLQVAVRLAIHGYHFRRCAAALG